MSLFNKKETISNKPAARALNNQNSATLLKTEGNKVDISEKVKEYTKSVIEGDFSDMYIMENNTCYIWSRQSSRGLKVAKFTDLNDFIQSVINGYDGVNHSYLVNYKGTNFRVERSVTKDGNQYCARKMLAEIPKVEGLGFPKGIYRELISLANKTGLILLAGATGMGKSTTISALIKKYLETEGGFAYTIEDPVELPLDGIYKTKNGDLGLCKQTTPPNGSWEDGIKSALRSRPHYIYMGEIRSADAAIELLRAAVSGHLVFSTIHANNINDAIVSLVKYASSGGMSETLAYELTANGLLACVHQTLSGIDRKLNVDVLFANPNPNMGCPVRAMIRSGNLNIGTMLESQQAKMEKGLPLFE